MFFVNHIELLKVPKLNTVVQRGALKFRPCNWNYLKKKKNITKKYCSIAFMRMTILVLRNQMINLICFVSCGPLGERNPISMKHLFCSPF